MNYNEKITFLLNLNYFLFLFHTNDCDKQCVEIDRQTHVGNLLPMKHLLLSHVHVTHKSVTEDVEFAVPVSRVCCVCLLK